MTFIFNFQISDLFSYKPFKVIVAKFALFLVGFVAVVTFIILDFIAPPDRNPSHRRAGLFKMSFHGMGMWGRR